MEYTLLMEFITWCESNSKTEWMGYRGAAEKIVAEFLEYKYNKTEKK